MEQSRIQQSSSTMPVQKRAESSKERPKKRLGLSTMFMILVACFALNTIGTIRRWHLIQHPHFQHQGPQNWQQQHSQQQHLKQHSQHNHHSQQSQWGKMLRQEQSNDSNGDLEKNDQRILNIFGMKNPLNKQKEQSSNQHAFRNEPQQISNSAEHKELNLKLKKWKEAAKEKQKIKIRTGLEETEEEDDDFYLFDVNKIPYYLQGKDMRPLISKSQNHNLEKKLKSSQIQKEMMNRIISSPVRSMMEENRSKFQSRQLDNHANNATNGKNNFHLQTYALPHYIRQMTRNHDSIFLGDDPEYTNINGKPDNRVISILGRHSRYIQWLDVMTGESGRKRTKGLDPAGWPLDDLNHVNAVLVDVIDDQKGDSNHDNHKKKRKRKEIWVPCGFHGDEVNNETSTSYARIIDVDTLTTRSGPKLPHTTSTQGGGGACVANALQILPNEPPMICMFSGTRGTHDAGYFLPQTACYDRIRNKWWDPFGNLPYGLDHANLVVVPPNRCQDGGEYEPARVLIFNFRTVPYGDCHPEFLAYDLPKSGWTLEQLQKNEETFGEREGEWYTYHVTTDLTLPQNIPRDASGIVVANNGRTVLNFAGTAHKMVTEYDEESNKMVQKRKRVRFSMIRAFDVCTKTWTEVGDIGLGTLAIQSAGSEKLQVAITVGGEAPTEKFNSPFCFVSRLESSSDAGKFRIDNQHKVVEYIGV